MRVRMLYSGVSVFACFMLIFGLSPPLAHAEDVTFPGVPLQNFDGSQVLAPSGIYDPMINVGKSTSISGNNVILNSGNPFYVYGAINRNDTAAVTGNRVVINGGTTELVFGASSKGDSTGNSVIVNGGSVHTLYGGRSSEGYATGNSVTITGGTVGSVVGGEGFAGTNNNTVTISGAPVISTVIGGMSNNNVHSGNTLNLYSAGLTIHDLMNFENYNFYLPPTLTAGQTMLHVTNTALIGNNAKVNLGIAGGASPLRKGDQVVLIDASAAHAFNGTLANTTANGEGMQGVTLHYGFDLTLLNQQLLAQVNYVDINPQTKSLSEGRIASLAFLNQGSDLIIGPGMYGVLASTRDMTQGSLVPFAVGSGGWDRYDTGSHIDVSGASMMTGLIWRQPINEGKSGSVLAGPFFEAGWGAYDSYNSFNNYASVKGDGDISYYGGGVLGHYDFAQTGPGNIYLDASFRAGHVSTDFSSSDLIDTVGRKADYDSGNPYYGAHAGLGYLWNITDKASLDFSSKYLWTHENSDNVKVLDDPVNFETMDSHRWRSGVRFAYVVNDYITPYAGAHYDHEFEGKAQASTNGYKIDAPNLKGGTGVGQLGLTIKPVKDSGFSMDLGAQGYIGVREGVSGNAQLKFEF